MWAQQSALLAALAALAALQPARACPFSGAAGPADTNLPRSSHPGARRLATYVAPDVITDPTNSMVDSGALTNLSSPGDAGS